MDILIALGAAVGGGLLLVALLVWSERWPPSNP